MFTRPRNNNSPATRWKPFCVVLACGLLLMLPACTPASQESTQPGAAVEPPREDADSVEEEPAIQAGPALLEVSAYAIRLTAGEITTSVLLTNRTDVSVGGVTLEVSVPNGGSSVEVLTTPLDAAINETSKSVVWSIPSIPAQTIAGPFAYRATVAGAGTPIDAAVSWLAPTVGDTAASIVEVEDATLTVVTEAMSAKPVTTIARSGVRYFVPLGDRGQVSLNRTDLEPPAGTADDLTWIGTYEVTKEISGSALFEVPLAQPAPPYSLVRVFVDESEGYFEQMTMGAVASDGLHATFAADGSSHYALGALSDQMSGGSTYFGGNTGGAVSNIDLQNLVAENIDLQNALANQWTTTGLLGIDLMSLVTTGISDDAGSQETEGVGFWVVSWTMDGGMAVLTSGGGGNCGGAQGGVTLSTSDGSSFTSCSNGSTTLCDSGGTCTSLDPHGAGGDGEQQTGIVLGPGCGSWTCFTPLTLREGDAGGGVTDTTSAGGSTGGGGGGGGGVGDLSTVSLSLRDWVLSIEDGIMSSMNLPPPPSSNTSSVTSTLGCDLETNDTCIDASTLRSIVYISGQNVLLLIPGGQDVAVSLAPSSDFLLQAQATADGAPPTSTEDVTSAPPDLCVDHGGLAWTGETCVCEGVVVEVTICQDQTQFETMTDRACTPDAAACAEGGDGGGPDQQTCKTSAGCPNGQKCVSGVCVSP